MRKLLLLALALVLLISGLPGCTRTAAVAVLQSDKPRNASPSVTAPDLAAVVDGNSAFALDLYRVLAQGEGNLFYSPYSISVALAMTYAGARGGTEKAMADALDFTLPGERLHPAFNSLDLQLKERGQGAKGKDGKGFRLNVVNALWGQKDFPFLGEFLDVLAQNYGAGLRVLDFVKETEQSRVAINRWVSEQTEDRIKDLVPPGALNTLTRLVLTNAVYFNAAWQHPFNKEATSPGPFYLLSGSTVSVSMMKQTKSLPYAEGDSYQAVELPYDGGELSMLVLLPRAGQFDAFEKAMDAGMVKGIVGRLANKQVALTMPSFQYEAALGLKKALTALGMGVAFTEEADLSGMDGRRDLLIQDVLHKAFVAVDEAGTEAAAATAVIVGITSAPAEPVEVTVDRPFIFLIRDNPTGSIIFAGRVLNPSAK